MALWLLFRPKSRPEATERQVADLLNQLPDTWLIRWGFLYDRNDDSAGRHEGDFLIFGPSGHGLVLEVKGNRVRNFVLTGAWEGEDGHESPWVQVNEQWKWACARAESVRGTRPCPFLHRALALPFTSFGPGDRFRQELPREHVIGASDLQRFTAWWDENVARVRLHGTPADARAIFLEAFAEGLRPRAIRAFIQETERRFERAADGEARLLGLLDGNRQLMVQGGAGSGKTRLALHQAIQHAASGRRTLLLCYNLALADHLQAEAARLAPETTLLTVLSWEALTGVLLGLGGFRHEPPEAYEARREYYHLTVPSYLLDIVSTGLVAPRYDALVVDEAQDHDTEFPPELRRPDLPGWWHFYFALLAEGVCSPMAIFYDPAQRPRFRRADGFRPERLRTLLSDCAHLRLPGLHRYTRPVHAFLAGLATTGAQPLVAQLMAPLEALPEGPEVEQEDVPAATDLAEAVLRMARRWEKLGFCRLRDVVVIGRHRDLALSGVGPAAAEGRLTIRPYTARPEANDLCYLSVNRAKGLDFLAVIVIDLPRPGAPGVPPDQDEAVFMAASRARQVLGLLHAPAPAVPAA